ncbi:MAG: hypothetical protein SVW02_03400 [Candidatus Nanohaloarchaea archaeon]|nr:hypothetical protein [Candidatus Nanohaloarchaea archaeon]
MALDQLRGAVEPVDIAIIAALSFLAAAPLFVIQPQVAAISGLQPPIPLGHLVILLLLIPLPAAYVASISGERFRVESLAALATLPLAVFGAKFAAVSLGLVLGLPLVSYKARNLFHEDNYFWTRFKASAALLSIMAVVAGVAAVQVYSGSPAVQDAVQGNVTAVTVDTAAEFADISSGSTSLLTGMAAGIAVNTSRATVAATEQVVLTAVNQSDGFSAGQRQVLQSAFTTAEQTIPPRFAQRARSQVRQRLAEQTDVNEQAVRSRIAPIIGTVTAPEPPMLVVLFLSVASAVYLFRLPAGLVAASYAMVGRRINRAASSGGQERPDRGQRRREQA